MEASLEMGERLDGCGAAGLHELKAALTQVGFDASDAAYVTYSVEVRTWEHAMTLSRDARRHGWHTSVYVDGPHWVVRLVRFHKPSPLFVSRACRYINDLACRHSAQVRCLSVEDPLRADCLDEIMAHVLGPSCEAEPAAISVTVPPKRAQRLRVDEVPAARGA